MRKGTRVLSSVLGAIVILSACSEQQEAEVKAGAQDAGEQIEGAAESAGQAIEKGAERLGDAAKEVGQEVRDTTAETQDTSGRPNPQP